MKKLLFFLAVSILSSTLFSQSTHYYISGKVVDAVSKNPLQAASVFAQNTTLGTTTDANGNFKLQLPNGGYDLAITYTGYETASKRITTSDAANPIIMEIKQQEKSMAEVAIKSTSEVKDGWEKYGSFFTENFIGKTTNSKLCTIKNPDSLKFYFYKRKNRLKVLSNTPIEIENNALGYKIKYALDSFAYDYNTNASVYTGSPLFEEMQPANEEQRAQWDANREETYNGSLLQLMRNIYDKNLGKDEFEIQFIEKNKDSEMVVAVQDIYAALNYTEEDSTQTVEITPSQKTLAIIYKKEKPDVAYITANPQEPADFQLTYLFFSDAPSIIIEQNGYFYEQNDVTLNGWMAWEKIADMLPYDYMED
jgi:hypothetical protein